MVGYVYVIFPKVYAWMYIRVMNLVKFGRGFRVLRMARQTGITYHSIPGEGQSNNTTVSIRLLPVNAYRRVCCLFLGSAAAKRCSCMAIIIHLSSTGRYGHKCWTNIFSPKFPHVPLKVGGWPMGYKDWNSGDVGLIVRAISFRDFQPMWSWSTNVTDGQTTCDRKTAQDHALHYSASRGKTISAINTKVCSLHIW